MELGKALALVRKNGWISILPAALSLAFLSIGLSFNMLPAVKEGIHFKFTVPTGMPSLGSILQQSPVDGSLTLPLLMLALANAAVGAFLSGGWLTGVFNVLQGRTVTQDEFIDSARYFFGRLFRARVLVFLVMLFGVLLVVTIFGPLSLVLLLVAIVYTFFWELAIVREDLSLGEGLARGYQLLTSNLGRVIGVCLPIGLLSGLFSMFANPLARSIVGYVLLVPIWSFIGAAFSVAVCSLYGELVRASTPPQTTKIQ